MVPGAAFALAVLRINCLVAGCCAGRISQLPWALRFPAGSPPWYAQTLAGRIPFDAAASLPVHPLQVYFLLLALALGILALWWLARRAYDGQLVLLFLALHEGGKALLEPLRQPPVPQLEVVSAAVAVAASLTLLAVWARARVRAGLEAA
jgi:prolipoprotein diacylglyceryltransferase